MKKIFLVLLSIMVLVLFGCLLSDDPANNEKDDINIEKEAKDNIEGDGNEGQDNDEEVIENSDGDDDVIDSTDNGSKKDSIKTEECVEIKRVMTRNYVYTWIEENSEGKRDTIFQFTNCSIPLACSDFVGIDNIVSPIYRGEPKLNLTYNVTEDTIEVCPADSLYNEYDLTDLSIKISYIDTVFLNYTENAIYEDNSIVPIIEIINKDAIINAFDTLYYGISGQFAIPVISHFQNDSIDWDIEFITDTKSPIFNRDISLGYGCEISEFDPCNKKEIECPQNDGIRSTKILITDSIPKIEGDELKWRLIVNNRFGFTDTLEVTSKLVTAVCPAQAE